MPHLGHLELVAVAVGRASVVLAVVDMGALLKAQSDGRGTSHCGGCEVHLGVCELTSAGLDALEPRVIKI